MTKQKNVAFQTWIEKIARTTGTAADEIAKLKTKFPVYKNDKSYATKYPLAHRNYVNYCKRGSQKKAA